MTESPATAPAAAAPPSPPALPAGFVEHHVDVDGRSVRYLEAGTGEPLVMVHGGGGLGRESGPAHAALAARNRVLAIELPGWGGSSADGIDSMADLATLVAGFARALGLDSVGLVGTSFGGAVALRVALAYPDLVRALVLEAPAAFREGVPGPGEIPPFAPDGTPIPRPDPAQVAFLERISGPATDPDLVAGMPGCRVPALVLLGTEDRLFGPRFAADYSRLGVVTVSLVYGAGHDIKGARPEAFVSIVSDFLDRGPSFVISQQTTLVHP